MDDIHIRPFPVLIDSPAFERLEHELRERARADWAAELAEAPDGFFPAGELDRQVEAEIGRGIARHWPAGLQEDIARGLFLAARLISPLYAPEAYRNREVEILVWVAEAGRALDASGGLEAMQNAYYRLKPLIGGQAVHLSRAWNGVGSWRH